MQIYEIKHYYIKRSVASEPTQESESNTPLSHLSYNPFYTQVPSV